MELSNENLRKILKILALPAALGFLALLLLDVEGVKYIQVGLLSVVLLDLFLDARDKYRDTGSQGDFALPIIVFLYILYMLIFT